jgi:hypothetical protein
VYEDAAKKVPRDEEFSKFWFHQMVLRNNIDGARKVWLADKHAVTIGRYVTK